MNKNIKLVYFLSFFKYSWFWLGIWIFYYLRFTTYAGIGLIETIMITTMVITEIPTGAIADLLGKKNTIISSFIFNLLGVFIMAIALNFSTLILSVFLLSIGSSLYSGTMEAFVYDTLKQDNLEDKYPKIIANIHSIQLISPALCGAIGGFIYKFNPRSPFFLSAIFYLFGLIITLFLTEPIIDTIKFSFKNYLLQTKKGLQELFKNSLIKKQTILLLSVGFIVVIFDQMMNSILGVEFGIKPQYIGIIWSFMYFVSAISLQIIPFFLKTFKENITLVIIGLLIALTMIFSPKLGLILGTFSIILRYPLQSIYFSLTSIMINKNTESKYRATTLSTFNMINSFPYVCTAFFIGSLSDKYSAKNISMYLGIALVLLLIFQFKKSKSSFVNLPHVLV